MDSVERIWSEFDLLHFFFILLVCGFVFLNNIRIILFFSSRNTFEKKKKKKKIATTYFFFFLLERYVYFPTLVDSQPFLPRGCGVGNFCCEFCLFYCTTTQA